MGRESETEKEETQSDLSPFSGLKEPYQAAQNGDWGAMKSFFDKYPQLVDHSLTIDGLTALHIAADNGRTELLQHLLNLLPRLGILAAISKKSDHGHNVFHEVAATNNIESAILLINKLVEAHGQPSLTGNNLPELKKLLEDRNNIGETPLYRAAALGQTKMCKFLAQLVGDITNHYQRNDSMSILHTAVLGEHFGTAIWLIEKDKTLGTREEIHGMTCLHLLAKMPSAFRGSCDMSKVTTLLYYCLPVHLDDDAGDIDDGNKVRRPSSEMEDLERGSQEDSSYLQSNKRVSAIPRIYYALWRSIAKGLNAFRIKRYYYLSNGHLSHSRVPWTEWNAIDEIWKAKRKHKSALELTKVLVKMDTTWASSLKVENKPISLGKHNSLDNNIETEKQGKGGEGEDATTGLPLGHNQTPDTPLLIAASEGIVEIFDKIVDVHPQAIEHVSKDEVSIVHAAISNRQREIFRRLKMMKRIMKHRLFSMIDKRGYTILHHAADMRNYKGGTRPGPALQLQEELQWFERVRKMIPSHYVMHRNNAGKTAEELFKEQHAELLEKAERWIKETSQSCSAIAVLVATVVFTAAYTVPGGNDQKGRPVFLHSPFFLFFTIMDAISLASSLTYVVIFLSILTSPFKQENFLRSLPRKLMIGFTLLFLSMTTTMLSFTATIFLINHFEKRALTVTLVNIAVLLPVSVFALTQFPLYLALTSSMHSLLKKVMKKAIRWTSVPQRCFRIRRRLARKKQ